MKRVKSFEELFKLVDRRKSVLWGDYKRRTPAACFINMQASYIQDLLMEKLIWVYEPKGKKNV